MSPRGFTVIELMLVTVLLAIFFGAVYETAIAGLRTVDAADEREEIRGQLAATLDRLTRELALCDNVDAATDSRFQCDTPSVNNVEYTYSSSNDELTRDDAAVSARIVLRNATAWDFDYVDSAGAALSTPVAGASEDTIRIVQVTATAALDAETLSMTSAVYLRNM